MRDYDVLALGKVKLEDCCVEWYSPVDVYAFKQGLMSKMSRSIGVDVLGISKSKKLFFQCCVIQNAVELDNGENIFDIEAISKLKLKIYFVQTFSRRLIFFRKIFSFHQTNSH